MNTNVAVTNSEEVLIGRVKWFNNKSGFGFITVTDGQNSGSDIFVHHSAINVVSEQYKYLVQGEYVEFKLIELQDNKHTCQATNVSGIKGGKLMCETRSEFRTARNSYQTTNVEGEADIKERQVKPVKLRGSGPRDESDWSYVTSEKKSNSNANKNTSRPRKAKTDELSAKN